MDAVLIKILCDQLGDENYSRGSRRLHWNQPHPLNLGGVGETQAAPTAVLSPLGYRYKGPGT